MRKLQEGKFHLHESGDRGATHTSSNESSDLLETNNSYNNVALSDGSLVSWKDISSIYVLASTSNTSPVPIPNTTVRLRDDFFSKRGLEKNNSLTTYLVQDFSTNQSPVKNKKGFLSKLFSSREKPTSDTESISIASPMLDGACSKKVLDDLESIKMKLESQYMASLESSDAMSLTCINKMQEEIQRCLKNHRTHPELEDTIYEEIPLVLPSTSFLRRRKSISDKPQVKEGNLDAKSKRQGGVWNDFPFNDGKDKKSEDNE